jgi:heptosyltransferase-3
MNRIDLPSHPRILVVALRRLGDVLLTTPLIRSLRHAWPDATIDALVFADTTGILRGNPDLSSIVAMPAQPTVLQSLTLAARLWRKYDLAISTQSGDRPTFFGSVAGRIRVGLFKPNVGGRLKRHAYRRGLPIEPGVHRVEEILRFADLLGSHLELIQGASYEPGICRCHFLRE